MADEFSLRDQVAVVTGASRGIGRAVAHALAGAGADLVLVARNKETVKGVAREIEARGRRALPVTADISNADEVAEMVAQARAEFSQIHILVNNAATSPFARLAQDLTPEAWDEVMSVNLKGTFMVTNCVGKHMISRGYGRIVNVTSVLAEQGLSRSIPYSPTKAAIRSLTQCLAADWAQYGINVNALAPGFIETEMNAGSRRDPSFVEAVRGRVTQHRWGRPEDLGGPAVFLASPAARYVTGTTLVVDGGFSSSWAYRN